MKDKQLLPLPPKPDGTVRIGREIKVLVNCFAFKNFPPSNAKIYHYDITIKRSGSGQDEARPSKSKQGDVRGFPERKFGPPVC